MPALTPNPLTRRRAAPRPHCAQTMRSGSSKSSRRMSRCMPCLPSPSRSALRCALRTCCPAGPPKPGVSVCQRPSPTSPDRHTLMKPSRRHCATDTASA
eukprot:scaffold132407_cov33-Tisochrysis_lutea.AAC.2